MKKILSLLLFLATTLTLQAGWNFKSGTRYYITCEWNNGGKVGLGSAHGQAYPLYYCMDPDAESDDCYWYIEGNDVFGYYIKNAKTGRYITYSSNYDDRYLYLAMNTTMYSYWQFTLDEQGFRIKNVNDVVNPFFNLRVGSSHYMHVGCYENADDSNGVFHIYNAEDGTEVQPTYEFGIIPTTIADGTFAQNTYWYRMAIRGNKYIHTNGADVLCNTTAPQDSPAFYWCFTRTANGYTLYNMATGASAPLYAQDSENGTYLLMSNNDGIKAFDLTENPNGGFNIQIRYTDACCNDFKDAGTLRLWNDLDAPGDRGSNITIEEIGCNIPITPGEEPEEPKPDDKDEGEVLPHNGDMVYILHRDNILTAIPKDYLRSYSVEDGTFKGELTSGVTLEYANISSASETVPVKLPTFTSYKFNNKFNPQLFTDAIASNPAAEEINISVGGIGKRLTPSFQLPNKDVKVWVGKTLQESKETRLRFDKPITYTIGYSTWRELQIVKKDDGTYKNRFVPFGYHTTVNIDWLTDHSTNTYSVPEIYITTNNGTPVTSKDYYWDATITIKGGGVFPDMKATPMQIKGRGNSSWGGYFSKNPYRIKFSTSQKPLGMTKGKNWILLANKQEGSMTTNAIGHKIASLMGAEAPCHIVPVELYMNGEYQGSYNLCEKLGFSNNSIALTDESNAAMIELDTYSDETIYQTNAYNICSKIHEPDIEDVKYTGPLTADDIIRDFDRMTEHVKAKDFVPYVDVEALVSFLATNELMINTEFQWPKSVFLYSENVTDGFDLTGKDPTPWKFGPLWDCDWSFGYEHSNSYYQVHEIDDYFKYHIGYGNPQSFWNDLRYGCAEVNEAYYARWHKFMTSGAFDELIEYCDDYYNFAAASLAHNNDGQFAYDYNDYEQVTKNSKNWLKKRAQNIFSVIPSFEVPRVYQTGDLNGDGRFTIADVAILVNVMLGYQFDLTGTADVNEDGFVNYADVVKLTNIVLGN